MALHAGKFVEIHTLVFNGCQSVGVSPSPAVTPGGITPHPHSLSPLRGEGGKQAFPRWVLALAACFTLLAVGWWASQLRQPSERKGTTSKAVAMLNRVVDAEWTQRDETPRLGAPLEPGLAAAQSRTGANSVLQRGARRA